MEPYPNKPWGPVDPNSQHQVWSRWVFEVHSAKDMDLEEVELNTARWLRKGFGSVGRVRVATGVNLIRIEAEVEGPPAHDPGYVASVKKGFRRFVEQGWGVTAIETVEVKFLAGDRQDGKPPDQLVVTPSIELIPKF